MNGVRVRTWKRRAVGAVTLAVAGFGLTCAGARGPGGAVGDRPPRPLTPELRALEREAGRIYEDAQDAFSEANYAAAESLANRVVEDYAETRWMGPSVLLSARSSLELNRPEDARSKAARYLKLYRAADPRRAPGLILVARTLHMEGQSRTAADTLLATPVELEEARDEAVQLARQVSGQLGIGEIDSVTARWASNHPLRPAFEVERASLLLAAGRNEAGREAAREVLGMGPAEPERERARAIADGEVEAEQWRPIIGAILPLSGPLAGYGRLAEEGIRLAIEEYNDRYYDAVTLIVRDDADRYERDGELARELERLGAVAIVGPLRAEGLERVGRDRRDRDLLVVSPTALENFSFERNTYSLWSTTERVTRGARALAAFAVRDLQMQRFGVMYPSNQEGRMQLAAFADAVRARGGDIVASVAYDDTANTFEVPMARLRAERPQVIYAPASNASSVIQMAPQFSYYGLRGVQVLGDAEWSAPEVLRLVEARFVNGTVISTFLDRESPSVRWPDFVEMYERKYRKGLEGNIVPALAYDATRLILASLPWGYPRRSAISRSFARIRSMPGATGVFSVESGSITRRPFLLQFKEVETGRTQRLQLVPAYDERRAVRHSNPGEGRRP